MSHRTPARCIATGSEPASGRLPSHVSRTPTRSTSISLPIVTVSSRVSPGRGSAGETRLPCQTPRVRDWISARRSSSVASVPKMKSWVTFERSRLATLDARDRRRPGRKDDRRSLGRGLVLRGLTDGIERLDGSVEIAGEAIRVRTGIDRHQEFGTVELPAEHVARLGRLDALVDTRPERRVILSERHEALEVASQVMVPGDFVVPRECLASPLVWQSTVEANLAAVVDGRRAGVGEKERRRQLEASNVTPEDRQRPGGVVTVQQVERRQRDVPVIGRQQIVDLPGVGKPVDARPGIVAAVLGILTDDPLTAAESERGRREGVVHQRVEAIALQELGPDVPYLAHDPRVRVDRPDPLTEFLPESLCLDLLRNVQTPAVDALFHPVLADTHDELPHLGIVGIELRQRVQPDPGLVSRWPVVVIGVHRELVTEDEPIEPGGRRTVLEHVVELEEAATGMVEHAVEDDADAALLARLEESLERVIATQQRVDLVVIVRMVAMVRGRL